MKNYIKKAIFTAAVSVSLIALGASITATHAIDRLENIESKSSVPTVNQSVSYCIREHGEIIGVFDMDDNLIYTLDVYTKTLPEKDRLLLKEGIIALNYEELFEILGDYDG